MSTATPGATIDLMALCTDSTNGGSFTLPTAANVTIEGAAAGDGFDGTCATGPALHGTGATGLTLRNLTFENYSLTSDSAVELQLSSGTLPTIDHDSFVNNTNSSGGTPSGAGLDITGLGVHVRTLGRSQSVTRCSPVTSSQRRPR